LLEFEGGIVGLALNLDEDSIGTVILGDSDLIEEGQPENTIYSKQLIKNVIPASLDIF